MSVCLFDGGFGGCGLSDGGFEGCGRERPVKERVTGVSL
jgi:hypothetical protein